MPGWRSGQGAAELEAIDIFVDTDPEDPTGERLVWQVVASASGPGTIPA